MSDEETKALRERVLVLEMKNEYLEQKLDKTIEVLERATDKVDTLQKTLDALLNRGAGATLLARSLLALGGLGWLAGIASFAQQFFTVKSP